MILLVHSSDRPAVSREFLVRQSVLNALVSNFPFGLRRHGTVEVLRKLMASPYGVCHFAAETRIEFRKLTGTYQEADDQDDILPMSGGALYP